MILIQHSLKDNDGYTCLFERNKIYRKVLLQRHFTNSHESYTEWRRSMRSPCAKIQLRSNTEFPLTLASAFDGKTRGGPIGRRLSSSFPPPSPASAWPPSVWSAAWPETNLSGRLDDALEDAAPTLPSFSVESSNDPQEWSERSGTVNSEHLCITILTIFIRKLSWIRIRIIVSDNKKLQQLSVPTKKTLVISKFSLPMIYSPFFWC